MLHSKLTFSNIFHVTDYYIKNIIYITNCLYALTCRRMIVTASFSFEKVLFVRSKISWNILPATAICSVAKNRKSSNSG